VSLFRHELSDLMQKVVSKMSDKNLVKAVAKYIRMSPFKLRRVADVVRGKSVEDAIAILSRMPHKGARLILQVLNSAKANAEHNNKITSGLYISELLICEGPRFKRYQARARGRMFQIIKRTSHIHVGLNTAQGVTNGK